MHIDSTYRRKVHNAIALAWPRSISLMVFCVAILYAQVGVFAGVQATERHIVAGESGILIKSGDDGSVLILEGRIIAADGYSVRMLPGTHIKCGDAINVSIVSKEHHEQLAEKAAREKRQEAAESIIAQRDENPVVPEADTLLQRLHPGFGSSATIGQQLTASAVLPIRTQSSQQAHTAIINKHILSFDIHDYHFSSFRPFCCPDLSWGKRAECIRVMLA